MLNDLGREFACLGFNLEQIKKFESRKVGISLKRFIVLKFEKETYKDEIIIPIISFVALRWKID